MVQIIFEPWMINLKKFFDYKTISSPTKMRIFCLSFLLTSIQALKLRGFLPRMLGVTFANNELIYYREDFDCSICYKYLHVVGEKSDGFTRLSGDTGYSLESGPLQTPKCTGTGKIPACALSLNNTDLTGGLTTEQLINTYSKIHVFQTNGPKNILTCDKGTGVATSAGLWDQTCTNGGDAVGVTNTNNTAPGPHFVDFCSDGVQNGDETDVDCGGTSCSKCANGLDCSENSDCTSGNCDSGQAGVGKCSAPSAPACTSPKCDDNGTCRNKGDTCTNTAHTCGGGGTDGDCGTTTPSGGAGRTCENSGITTEQVCRFNDQVDYQLVGDFDNNNKVEFLDAVNFLNCFNQARQDQTAAANNEIFVKSHYKKIYEEWPQSPWGTAESMCQKVLNQFKV